MQTLCQKLVVVLIAFTVLPGCSESPSEDDGSGSGATGGTNAAGGLPGAGGVLGSAGLPGSGGVAGSAGTDASGGGGSEVECSEPTDCPDPMNECVARTCDEGVCGAQNIALDTPVTAQTVGDCRTAVCNGNGGIGWISDAADVENDANVCTADSCEDDNPVHTPVAVATGCTQGGGKVCSASGTCVECNVAGDCSSNVCQDNTCRAAACADGARNGSETDTDCGGSCGPCADGKLCATGTDCLSMRCSGTCQVATCEDGTRNGSETDVDCGGSCTKCGPGKQCNGASDCVGNSCLSGSCAPTCTDGVENNLETDVDCGGGSCADCGNSRACLVSGDCTSGFCRPDTRVCAAPSCSDGFENGTETDVDCGGSCATKCAVGESCAVNADCQSGMCSNTVCGQQEPQVNGCTVTSSIDMTASASATVTFTNYVYSPKCLKVSPGTIVNFVGNFSSHPLLGGEIVDGVRVPATSGPFATVTNSGTMKSFTMSSTGTYPYYCTAHWAGGMIGAVFVVP